MGWNAAVCYQIDEFDSLAIGGSVDDGVGDMAAAADGSRRRRGGGGVGGVDGVGIGGITA